MGKRIYDTDFEEFLKDQSDQHRMYPSDHVWRNINKEIHGYSKWPALTIIAIFIITALVIGTVLTNPHSQLSGNATTNDQVIAANSSKTGTGQLSKKDSKSVPVSSMSIDKITQETIDVAKETVQRNKEILIIDNTITAKPDPVIATIPLISFESNNNPDHVSVTNEDAVSPVAGQKSSIAMALESYNFMREMQNTKANFPGNHSKNQYQFFAVEQSSPHKDVFEPQFNFELQQPASNTIGSRISKIGNKTNRIDFQFYLTPSLSYRRLVDNAEGTLSKSYISALPYSSNYIVDVNQVINHKPSTGLEIGFNLGYNLNKKLAVRSGFQFNMQQYKIDAFVHSFEPATIALSDGASNIIFNTVSGFSNNAGSEPIELTNRYYQVSLPVILDWRPVAGGKFSWGVAGSIQPTYTFDKEPFIITSNYKNYADGSELMRNWNLNASLETYVGYTVGKYRWQLGPQFRYQLLPTMANSYPIKEYLLDYGIKLGLIRTLK